jgi:lysozyme family protein
VNYPARYERAFDWLMGIEGFYSNHPADTGGETAWGISIANYPHMWRNGAPSREAAMGFYYTEFWRRLKCDELVTDPVAQELFEGAVLMGHQRAARFAQKAVNAISTTDRELVEDGVIGPKTIQSLNYWGQRYPAALYNTMNVIQGAFLLGLNRRDFVRGWMSKRIQAVQGK